MADGQPVPGALMSIGDQLKMDAARKDAAAARI